ncbi:hypothetical protein D3C71_1802720 [compost metagenome]
MLCETDYLKLLYLELRKVTGIDLYMLEPDSFVFSVDEDFNADELISSLENFVEHNKNMTGFCIKYKISDFLESNSADSSDITEE